MKKKLLLKIILVASYIWSNTIALSGQEITFQNYSVTNGLSNSRVRSFCKDHYGFAWIGTASGLNRFDGYQFETYGKQNEIPGSLLNNGVLALLEDNHYNLWIGTKKGLQLYDRERDCFFPDPLLKDHIFSEIDHVLAIYEDSFGAIWIAAVNGRPPNFY